MFAGFRCHRLNTIQEATLFFPRHLSKDPCSIVRNGPVRAPENCPAQDGALVSLTYVIPFDPWNSDGRRRGDGACGKTSALNVFTRGSAVVLLLSLTKPLIFFFQVLSNCLVRSVPPGIDCTWKY